MRTSRVLRWTVLAAILAAFAPAPASAQLGRFIKKKFQEKIAKTVVENVVGVDTPVTVTPGNAQPAPAGAQRGAPAVAKKGAPGRAVKGAEPVAAPAASVFDDRVLEMTPAVLDRLEKGLAAEAAERQANARVLARMRDKAGYDKCSREVAASPEGKRMMALLDAGDMKAYQQAAVEVQKVQDAKCGPSPNSYRTVEDNLRNKPSKAGEDNSGFDYWQYSILKERALPFCTMSTPAGGGAVKIPVRADVFLVYSPAEVDALKVRCARLLPALKSAQ